MFLGIFADVARFVGCYIALLFLFRAGVDPVVSDELCARLWHAHGVYEVRTWMDPSPRAFNPHLVFCLSVLLFRVSLWLRLSGAPPCVCFASLRFERQPFHRVTECDDGAACLQIATILRHIAKKEGLRAPDAFLHRIVQASERNLRRAILMFEACKVAQ